MFYDYKKNVFPLLFLKNRVRIFNVVEKLKYLALQEKGFIILEEQNM